MSGMTVRALIADASKRALCREARRAWVRKTASAVRAAQREMDDRCTEAVGRLSEEEFERLCRAEQAKVEAFLGPLRTAAEQDRWPRELYRGGI